MSAPAGTEALGTPIRGPSAVGGGLGRFVALTRTIAVMEFKVRFFGSALGYLWTLVRPLMLFGVLFVVFTKFVRFNEGVPYFPAALLTGIVLYTFFSDATSRAVTSVVDRETLVRKVQFPRLVVPLATVLSAAFNFGLNLVAVLVFVLATGVDPRVEWLLFPLLAIALAALAVGTSALLSALYVRFRDVAPIWEVLLQVLFYASPILYAIEIVPDGWMRHVIMANPLAVIVEQSRHWVIDASAPSAAEAAGSTAYLLVPLAISVAVIALGLWVFAREAPRIAEEL
jgi:ABC-2 type transport system permease protein